MKIYRLMSYYIGFVLYALLIGAIFWIIYYIFKAFGMEHFLDFKQIGIFLVVVFLFVNIWAIYNFEKGINVEKFIIKTDKVKKDYTIVQIGDIQFGSVDKEYMENVLKLTMKQKPDFIVFVGDLIDFESYKRDDFEYFKKISVPIYFINGNHDFYHDSKRLLSYLQEIKPINILLDEKVNFDEIEIVGIDYVLSKSKLIDKIEKVKLNDDKFSILLYHEPKAVEHGVEKGFDLMLFGHTHGGKIFPVIKIAAFLC